MKKWIKRSIIAVVILGAIGGAAVAITRAKASKDAEPKFKTAAIDKGNITQVVLASGTLQPVVSVNVGVQVSGTVSERLVDFNDHVKAGQILLRLDPAALKARIRQAQAQLESAQASLVLARANEERNVRLVKQGFISAASQEQSKRELGVAFANVELAKAQLDAVQTDLNNSVVRAPIDGVIIKRNIDIGQTVAATFQTPELFQIAADLKKMQIYSNVSEADVGYIKIGQPVRFGVDAYQGREFEGTVQQFRLNPTTTSGVVTYTIVISVDNAEELLKPGMSAQTRIVVSGKQNVLRIPTAALRFKPDDNALPKASASASVSASAAATTELIANENDDGVLNSTAGGKKVYRVYTMGADPKKPNLLVQHDVTIGIANTKFTELMSGDLKAGDQVVTRSLTIVPSGPN
jgi:HlyD family secretion protein